MNTDPPPDLIQALGSIKPCSYKFGTKPFSPLVAAPVEGDHRDPSNPRPEFIISWEDRQQGLKVLVQERDDGHLIASVFCADASLRTKAAVSVGLRGAATTDTVHKLIPLNGCEQNGCSGSADLGTLENATKELGSQLGVLVFLLVRKE